MADPVEELIREIAAKHGIAVSREDPIFVLHTINQRLLQDSARAQQAMLDQYKEELGAIAQAWGNDAKAKAERVLNAAMTASKEAAAKIMHEGATATVGIGARRNRGGPGPPRGHAAPRPPASCAKPGRLSLDADGGRSGALRDSPALERPAILKRLGHGLASARPLRLNQVHGSHDDAHALDRREAIRIAFVALVATAVWSRPSPSNVTPNFTGTRTLVPVPPGAGVSLSGEDWITMAAMSGAGDRPRVSLKRPLHLYVEWKDIRSDSVCTIQ